MKSILDPSFRYVSSLDTDVRKTFARIRRERLLDQRKPQDAHAGTTTAVVMRLRSGSAA